ncbi:PAS domain S-box protein [Desertibaculum subflavum]|uniref:PAS domain S-box protein n=1 Tax=Desertibaculum subflavum TaxID=2268458 RepID=UPI0013C45F98
MSDPEAKVRELAARNALLEATFEAMGEAICILDLNYQLISWNRRYAEMRSVPDHLAQVGTGIRDILRWQAEQGDFGPGAVDDIVEREFATAWATLPNRQELQLANGRIVDVRRYRLDGLGYVTIADDITERVRAETETRESRARFADFVDVSTDWVWEMDADLRFSFMSDQAQSVVGVPAEWFIGKRRDEIGKPPKDSGEWARHQADLDARRPFRDFELEVHLPTGAKRWISSSGKPIFDGTGRFLGYRGIGRDIGEKKRREEELRRSEQRLALHIENTPVGVIEWDADARITAWNRAAQKIFGYEPWEVIGRNGPELLVPESSRSKVTQGLMRMLAGQGGRRATNRNIAKDGRQLICDWYNTPIVDEQGGVIGGASLVQDVTDRMSAEAILREAKESAEQMSRAKSEFLATMSHELRTPLNAVIGFSELIMREAFGTVGPRYVSYARDIHTSGTHLLDIINDILDLSKIEAGKLDLSDEAVDLGRLIDSSIRLVQGRAAEAGVKLTSAVPPALPSLRADARALKQILINLLSNAIKFTPEGGSVTLAAAIAPNSALTIAITDTGIGMRPEDIPRAMEPFAQIESSLSRRFEGTGLGLPLCKRLAELHDATLELTSAPGEGTTATVRFPAARVIPRQPRLSA